jgi:hypothetical protein
MCTLSLFPRPPAGLRLMVNRDEQRSRIESLDPIQVAIGTRTAIMPIDPASGGTWVGVNDAGLVACLLNRTLSPEHAARFRHRASRGEIVPAILANEHLDHAVRHATRLEPHRWPPFRLFLAQQRRAAILTSNGDAITIDDCGRATGPRMLSSCGLGDEFVRSHREQAFAAAQLVHADPLVAQHAFHNAADPRHAALAPLMTRNDARTVSQTTIDVTTHGITLHHLWLDDELTPSREAREALSPMLALPR